MARPLKTGLEYFPLDVDFFEDDKIQLIAAEFGGAKAESLIIRLLCKIYKDGYLYQWGEDQCLLMAKSMGTVDCSKEWVQEVVQGLVRRCFFDKGCFDEFKILTSSAIQRRYISAIKERKFSDDNRPFWLLSSNKTLSTDEKSGETPVNRRETPVNPPDNTQSKVEESKGKKSKEKESREEDTPDPTHPFYSKYINFRKCITDEAPAVDEMVEPFTFAQFIKLYDFMMIAEKKNEVRRHKIMGEVLREMNNKPELTTKWRSASVTFQKFLTQKLKSMTNK